MKNTPTDPAKDHEEVTTTETSHWYTLGENKVPQPISFGEVLRQGENFRTTIPLSQHQIDKVRVSTIFLSLDHSFWKGKPVLFETMIFGGSRNQYMWRYHTYQEAMEGAKRALLLVIGDLRFDRYVARMLPRMFSVMLLLGGLLSSAILLLLLVLILNN